MTFKWYFLKPHYRKHYNSILGWYSDFYLDTGKTPQESSQSSESLS